MSAVRVPFVAIREGLNGLWAMSTDPTLTSALQTCHLGARSAPHVFAELALTEAGCVAEYPGARSASRMSGLVAAAGEAGVRSPRFADPENQVRQRHTPDTGPTRLDQTALHQIPGETG